MSPARIVGVAVIAAAAVAAGAFAGVAVAMARRVVVPPSRFDADLRVLAVDEDAGWIEFSVNEDSRVDGIYSFWFDADTGHATVGEILHLAAHRVRRRLLEVIDGRLTEGTTGRFAGWVYLDPEHLGVEYEDVTVTSDVGDCPAWLIPAASPTTKWVIQVHGRATRRSEGLRAVPVFRDAGYNSLLVSYRNDLDAPRSADHRYGMGATEWLDVEAAIRFAVARGASDIVLMGWSMGGGIALQAAVATELQGEIRGIVLESPAIDWVDILRFQARLMRVPHVVGSAALGIVSSSWGRWLTGLDTVVDFDRVDFVKRANELRVPILLLHSDDDGFVPIGPSRAFAAARPDIVRFVEFTEALHTKIWNHDREGWTSAIAGWLSELVRPAVRSGREPGT